MMKIEFKNGSNRFLVVMLAMATLLGACATQQNSMRDEGPKLREPPDEPFRAERPAAGADVPPQLPVFQKAELKNGVSIYLAENHALPIVDIQVLIRAGSLLDPNGQYGTSSLAFDMLDEGAGSYDAITLADAFARLGTQVGTGSGREIGWLGTGLLKRNVDAGLDLMATMVRKPTFGRDDFDRVKERRLSMLKQRAGQPNAVAEDVFGVSAYGSKHPYGRNPLGDATSVSKLSNKKLKAFWKKNAVPGNTALVFAGDLTMEEAKALGEKHFGKWKGRAKKAKAPKSPAAPKLSTQIVDFPGAPQTVVRVGRPVLKKGDPDEAAFAIMNQVLGGMFSSRLNMNLREDKGWTYGVYSTVNPMRIEGPVVAAAGIKTAHTAAALGEFFAEFDKLRNEPISQKELNAAKSNYVRSLPGRFETIGATADAAGPLFVFDLPLDYYATLPEKIEAVSVEDVQRVAAKALNKENLLIVLVGDEKTIAPTLEGVELGEVQRLDANGNKAQ